MITDHDTNPPEGRAGGFDACLRCTIKGDPSVASAVQLAAARRSRIEARHGGQRLSRGTHAVVSCLRRGSPSAAALDTAAGEGLQAAAGGVGAAAAGGDGAAGAGAAAAGAGGQGGHCGPTPAGSAPATLAVSSLTATVAAAGGYTHEQLLQLLRLDDGRTVSSATEASIAEAAADQKGLAEQLQWLVEAGVLSACAGDGGSAADVRYTYATTHVAGDGAEVAAEAAAAAADVAPECGGVERWLEAKGTCPACRAKLWETWEPEDAAAAAVRALPENPFPPPPGGVPTAAYATGVLEQLQAIDGALEQVATAAGAAAAVAALGAAAAASAEQLLQAQQLVLQQELQRRAQLGQQDEQEGGGQ